MHQFSIIRGDIQYKFTTVNNQWNRCTRVPDMIKQRMQSKSVSKAIFLIIKLYTGTSHFMECRATNQHVFFLCKVQDHLYERKMVLREWTWWIKSTAYPSFDLKPLVRAFRDLSLGRSWCSPAGVRRFYNVVSTKCCIDDQATLYKRYVSAGMSRGSCIPGRSLFDLVRLSPCPR